MGSASIHQLRASLGEPPRRLGLLRALRFRHICPNWVEPGSPLDSYFDVQLDLLRRGRLIWACVVKANARLYAPGSAAASGVAVWSADSWFDEHPRALRHIADHVDALRRYPADADPALGPCLQAARDDWRSHPRCVVPPRLTGGHPVFCGSFYIAPRELPRKLVANRLLPVMFDNDITSHVRVLPSSYWSPELRRSWEADAERRAKAGWEPYAIAEQLSVWLKDRPDARELTDHALSLARDAFGELDFPGAAHWALASTRSQAEEEARALLVDIVDHAATPLGLFDGAPSALSAALGTALVHWRYGHTVQAAAALDEVRKVEPDLALTWTRWLASLGTGPHRLET